MSGASELKLLPKHNHNMIDNAFENRSDLEEYLTDIKEKTSEVSKEILKSERNDKSPKYRVEILPGID